MQDHPLDPGQPTRYNPKDNRLSFFQPPSTTNNSSVQCGSLRASPLFVLEFWLAQSFTNLVQVAKAVACSRVQLLPHFARRHYALSVFFVLGSLNVSALLPLVPGFFFQVLHFEQLWVFVLVPIHCKVFSVEQYIHYYSISLIKHDDQCNLQNRIDFSLQFQIPSWQRIIGISTLGEWSSQLRAHTLNYKHEAEWVS